MQYRRMSGFFASAALLVGCIGLTGVTTGATPQQPATTKPQAQPQDRKGTNPVTDGWITMKIHSQFVTEDALEDSDIDVDTNARVVTLSGTVASKAGHARAVAIAKATEGVTNIVDKLRVAPERDADAGGTAREAGRETTGAAKGAGRRANDGWITSKIYSQFLTENALEDSDIDIDVTKGVVTLNGTVRSEAGRQRAVAIAKTTDGVKSVKDSLKVVGR